MSRGTFQPENNTESDRQKHQKTKMRPGCLVMLIAGIALWLAGAWLLWHGSMKGMPNRPASGLEENDGKPFFEIIPGSDESSFVEEDIDKDNEKAQSQ